MSFALNRLILYARDVGGTVAFYEKHFGFKVLRLPGDKIVELVAQGGGANLMIRQLVIRFQPQANRRRGAHPAMLQ